MTRRTENALIDLFNECSELIMAGESVTACLARYPEQAEALKPLLTAMSGIRRLQPVPARSPQVVAQSRARFLAAAGQRPAANVPLPLRWWHRFAASWRGLPHAMPTGMVAALFLVIFVGILATATITTSAKALPGDFLYPVKTLVDDTQVMLTRDPEARAALVEQIARERLQEAETVIQTGRRVRRMRIAGTIEAIDGSRWVISGLPVVITPETRIEGIPRVGAAVRGTVRATGKAWLEALLLIVKPLRDTGSSPVGESPIPTPTRVPPTPTMSPTVAVPSPTPVSGGYHRPVPVPTDPPEATLTATSAPTPTTTPTHELTPTPTKTPEPTRETKVKVIGRVEKIEGTVWTIDTVRAETNADTVFIGAPNVGYKVDALLLVRADGSYLALVISTISGPSAPPEPLDFTAVLEAKSGNVWVIGGTSVHIGGATIIEGDPQVGDMVTCNCEKHANGEVWALHIRKLSLPEYQFEGVIEAINGNTWVIGGHRVLVTDQTQIIGSGSVGRYAQVDVVERPDGQLVARVIYVVPDTPTPTPSPTMVATPTMTPTEVATPTMTPTEMATPTATSTEVPVPTATSTETPVPTATSTEMPVPTATSTEMPVPTATSTETPALAATSGDIPTLTPSPVNRPAE